MVRSSIPDSDSVAELLAAEPHVVVTSVAPDGAVWVSLLADDPGFVDVDGDTVVYPDYPGNDMFCTLGNVETDSRVGLPFVDFEGGRTLQATGRGEVVWNERRVAAYEGAKRLVEIEMDRAVELSDGNPLRWSLDEWSPFNP